MYMGKVHIFSVIVVHGLDLTPGFDLTHVGEFEP